KAKLNTAEIDAIVAADERVKTLQKELDQLKRKASTENTRDSLVIQEVRRLMEEAGPVVISPGDIAKPARDKRTKAHVEIPILCLGDIHLGYYHATGPFAYSVDIARQRVSRSVDKFLKTVASKRSYAKIEEMHLYLMGDMVEGENMRAGHGHEIEGPLIKQAI